MTSPFLDIPKSDWVAENDHAFAVRDRFPVSPGHTLVISRRLVPTWFDASAEEQGAVLDLIQKVVRQIESQYHPDGYNVGFNAGEAAGQTVMHLHVHVIPRYRGDMEDPRGGVRYVIPGKGNYLAMRPPVLSTGGENDPFLAHLRPLFSRASEIAIVAAFVQDSGLEILNRSIIAALLRGARVRVITGDYLNITQAAALQRLLDWMDEYAIVADDLESEDRPPGHFEARVVETATLSGDSKAFHPKSWRLEGPEFGAAFVGSSNISRSALTSGIEWNLRIDRDRDPEGFHRVVDAFEFWWSQARPLTVDWVAGYREQVRQQPCDLPVGEVEAGRPRLPPHPHQLQRDALEALRQSRQQGQQRALAVLATGLGKTWLAAFDVNAVQSETGVMPRVLFLTHRAELLRQAAETFRCMFPTARFGWFVGSRDDLDCDVLFASVQKLGRQDHIARIEARRFEYVIVDEVHHVAAPTYRRILNHLIPRFLLGLTATPDRADEADILDLFDDHLAYRADLGVGIRHELLVPFQYYGIRDTTDYQPIPWRNSRFDPQVLSSAVQTQARMERMWEAWQRYPAARTVLFCCSITHARFVRDWLTARGVRTEAVFAGRESADREATLEALAGGHLDAICAVDLLNEGIDLPSLDRVVMLRPTESPVIFLQQLGRGLRISPGKDHLLVIDFVGNHRVFLDRVRTLLSLSAEPITLRAFLSGQQAADLPPGCSVDIELEAIDLLRKLLPATDRNELVRVYRELRTARGTRPTAGELFRMGYNPRSLRNGGGWFGFVAAEGDLTEAETQVVEFGRRWFTELETTAMTKCFKMVVVEILLEEHALEGGMTIADLARKCHQFLVRSPELVRDLQDVKALPEPMNPDPADWVTYWKSNPIQAWTGTAQLGSNTAFFRTEEDRFAPDLPILEGHIVRFHELTRELVDYRLAQYRARQRAARIGTGFESKVITNQRDPILVLPERDKNPNVPAGEVEVRLPEGDLWQFRFAKRFCNVARPIGTQRNRLPDLMRRWFGPGAGRPGTTFHVLFTPGTESWTIEPVNPVLVVKGGRGYIVAYPTLQAAAGAQGMPFVPPSAADSIYVPGDYDQTEVFAVRATGNSMDGEPDRIRDGDWVVLRWARSASLSSVEGRVALVSVLDNTGRETHHLKRIVHTNAGFQLRSNNPSVAPIPVPEQATVIALYVATAASESAAIGNHGEQSGALPTG